MPILNSKLTTKDLVARFHLNAAILLVYMTAASTVSQLSSHNVAPPSSFTDSIHFISSNAFHEALQEAHMATEGEHIDVLLPSGSISNKSKSFERCLRPRISCGTCPRITVDSIIIMFLMYGSPR
jgi:hypothetical protein